MCVDIDWASDTATHKLNRKMVMIMGGNAVSWCSRQQEDVAFSSLEAE